MLVVLPFMSTTYIGIGILDLFFKKNKTKKNIELGEK